MANWCRRCNEAWPDCQCKINVKDRCDQCFDRNWEHVRLSECDEHGPNASAPNKGDEK